MGLRRHYVRPFFNGPCKATWISLCGFTDYFMYVYASYCMPFQHFEYYSMSFSLRMVPTIVIAHTFCASPDTRISYRQYLLIQGYFCVV